MKRAAWKGLGAAVLLVTLSGCATGGARTGWTTLVDGTRGLENFNRVGEANWTATDGAIQATQGGKDAAYLVSKSAYKDFMMRVEFWASDDANSGVFMRCQDAKKITDESCYEANIFDQRPDPDIRHRRHRESRQGGAHAQGGRQVEHVRDHAPRHPPGRGPERDEDR